MNKSTIEKAVWYNTYWCIDSNMSDVTIEVYSTENTIKVGQKITLKRGERFVASIIPPDDSRRIYVPIVITKTALTG